MFFFSGSREFLYFLFAYVGVSCRFSQLKLQFSSLSSVDDFVMKGMRLIDDPGV